MRKIGYEVMKCLKSVKPKEDNAVYLYMLKKEEEGKAKKVAKIAALNKFLRIYYARVKNVYNKRIFLDFEPFHYLRDYNLIFLFFLVRHKKNM